MTRSRTYLWLALGAFTVAVIFVNPLRGTTLDDDWAYTLTVRHLLESGRYQLHDWAAANMPFQAYLGALFSAVGGFSPAALRLSTVLLALLGLVAFYRLARESDLDAKVAGLLALILASSPLFLRFSLNFMTDVPFLAMLTASLWLYARAVRTGGIGVMLLASLAATAAVLTRQFGMAAIGAVALLWLTDREYRRRVGFFLAGLALPAAASLWQLWWGTQNPTWGQQYAKLAQSLYLGDMITLLGNAIWRPAAILLYMGLFALPLALGAILGLRLRIHRRSAEGGRPARPYLAWLLLVAIFLVVAFVAGHFLAHAPLLMPTLPWNFELLRRGGRPGMLAITLVTAAAGLLVGAAAIAAYFGGLRWSELSPAMRLLALSAGILLLMQIVFFKIGDEYLLVFLPFALIAAGRTLHEALAHHAPAIASAAMLVLIASSLWTRGLLESEDASWLASERARSLGGDPGSISGSWNWDCYNGAFDDYLRAIGRAPRKDLEEFFTWYRARRDSSRFSVLASVPRADGASWIVRDSVAYRSFLLDRHYVYVMERSMVDSLGCGVWSRRSKVDGRRSKVDEALLRRSMTSVALMIPLNPTAPPGVERCSECVAPTGLE